MPFDLDSLKDKLPGEMLEKLRSHVDELTSRAESAEDKARKAAAESISNRKTLKAERDAAFEKLGVDTMDELQALPDAKGQAEAARQHEAKLKKLERENADLTSANQALTGEVKGFKRDAALGAALDGLKFKNGADVRVLMSQRIVEDGDELRFKTDDGKLVPLKDGAAWFAKTRPEYVEAQGGGGGGGGFKGAGAGGDKNPFLRSTWNLTEQIAMKRENPALATQLEQQAKQAA